MADPIPLLFADFIEALPPWTIDDEFIHYNGCDGDLRFIVTTDFNFTSRPVVSCSCGGFFTLLPEWMDGC